ncbi:MAG TPA: HAMP domain-containing sensor histidine kinase [Candidatus Paceibacterota bacterium]
MPIELLIHNFGFLCSAFIGVAIGFFILLKDWKKHTYRLYFATVCSFAVYCFAYLLTVNLPDPQFSSAFGFLMTIAATTACLNAHLAFAAFNIEREQKWGLRIMYGVLIAMYGFFALDPGRVRLLSKPKAFFQNFFVPGPYYWFYFLFFFAVIAYFFTVLILHYRKADMNEQNRLKYFFLAFGWAYFWALPIYMMILDVPYGDRVILLMPLIGLHTIPLAYGVFKYDLMNIGMVVKNALLYGFFIVFVGGSVIAANLSNNYLTVIYPDFPIWIMPIFSGFLVLFVGFIVWNQLRQADLLKYEFINNISHKFRTPLTHIRWLAEELRDLDSAEDRNKAVDQIQFASMRLFELTSVVIDASKNTNDLALYRFADVDVRNLITAIDKAHKDQIASKKLQVTYKLDESVTTVWADKARLQFALQILFENALIYTPEGGSITVGVRRTSTELIISFKDTGIGISEADITHVFAKFFRTANARHTDTEGMGIGLYMAKDTIEKHKGRIWAESEGEGKGATFSVALPLNQ